MHGIRYRRGDTKKRVAPLEIADLRLCLSKMRERRGEDLTIIRDRALLSLGFFSALRRGELVALKVEDLEFGEEGLTVRVRRSKKDPFAQGAEIGIHPQKDPNVCPIALMKRYLEISEIKTSWIFRRIDSRSDCYGDRPLTPQVVALKVKEYCEKAGLDPLRFAGHSLRSGFATTAAGKGHTLTQIMRQGRWKDERTARSYIRPATIFRDNPTAGLGDDEKDDGRGRDER
jgi:integrase